MTARSPPNLEAGFFLRVLDKGVRWGTAALNDMTTHRPLGMIATSVANQHHQRRGGALVIANPADQIADHSRRSTEAVTPCPYRAAPVSLVGAIFLSAPLSLSRPALTKVLDFLR